MVKIYPIFAFLVFFVFTCKSPQEVTEVNQELQQMAKNEAKDKVLLGIDVLQENNFAILEGKRVGLVTNPTGVNSQLESTIDILHKSPKVNLVALFGPEHGVRGNFSAGDHVGNAVDKQTGVPVFSLYGKNRKPNAAAMALVDVLVYDIQDVGVRSYTYISTMGLVMEAAANYGKEVLVLDRPNPLGGERVEGNLVGEGYFSFVSQYKIPYVYGLTCGELAMLLNNEGLLKDSLQCSLQVLPMKNWKRTMDFSQTGLVWVPTSPHIPTWECAFYYAATGILGELDPSAIGIGYTLPFQTLMTSAVPAQTLANAMNQLQLPGVIFRPIFYKPYYKAKKGKDLQGVQIHITDFEKVNLTEIQFHFIQTVHQMNPSFNPFKGKDDRYRMVDYGCGGSAIREGLMSNFDFVNLQSYWRKDIDAFKALSKKYYLYQ
jgi:uncharacterized protein YbbC (DUF1343 family)